MSVASIGTAVTSAEPELAHGSTLSPARTVSLLELLTSLPVEHPRHRPVRAEVVATWLPYAQYLARRFNDRESLDTLFLFATLGLNKAIDRFDPHWDTPFCVYAAPTIVGEIKRQLRDRSQSTLPEQPLRARMARVSRAVAELPSMLGRAPTVTDLAQYLGLAEDEVIDGLLAEGVQPRHATHAASGNDRRLQRSSQPR